MELLAVIVALEKIIKKEIKVAVFSDSKYVVDAINKKWIVNWQKKNFEKIKNPDLWKRFLKTYNSKTTQFIWIKGHNNHPQNEQCDQLAVRASKKSTLLIDEGYETSIHPKLSFNTK
jgi:ribonuclease HI